MVRSAPDPNNIIVATHTDSRCARTTRIDSDNMLQDEVARIESIGGSNYIFDSVINFERRSNSRRVLGVAYKHSHYTVTIVCAICSRSTSFVMSPSLLL